METYNLEISKGYSLLVVVHAVEGVTGVKVPYEIIGRPAGDMAECYADTTKPEMVLGWKVERGMKRCAGTRGDGSVSKRR